jgi:dolichol-phosphate mannosyltransferase
MQEKISIILPIHNEAENIPLLYERLKNVLEGEVSDWEIIFVNDGSSDNSMEVMLQLKRKEKRVKVIDFSRNFGHQAALMAGIERAKGDVIVMMDADLQHPPELLPEIFNKYKEGYDIVSTIRMDDKHLPFFKKMTSSLFYRILRSISELDIRPGMADFRLITREVAEILKSMPEREKFLRGLFQWMGFKHAYVEYVASERRKGSPSYNLRKMIHFAISGITSFSALPLRISAILGFIIIISCLPYAFYSLYAKFFGGKVVKGWLSLLLIIMLLGGFQLISLGIIGEYLSKIFDEVKRRPPYIIKKIYE